MRNRHHTVSGMGSHNFGHLEDNSTLDISGMGSVDIGSIGQNVTINKSGMGSLNIRGSVHATAKFNISGMGSTNFTARPPQAVLDNLENSGMGSVNVPGGYTSKSPSSSGGTYVGNGGSMIVNGAVINGGGVIRNLVMDSSGIRYTDASGKNVYMPNNSGGVTFTAGNVYNHTPAPVQKPASNTAAQRFSNSTQTYIDSFKDKPKFSDTYINLLIQKNVSKALDGFPQFFDPITHELMDRPVSVNGTVYDLDTLLQQSLTTDGRYKEGSTGYSYSLNEIQPARYIAENIQKELDRLRTAENKNASQPDKTPSSANSVSVRLEPIISATSEAERQAAMLQDTSDDFSEFSDLSSLSTPRQSM